MDEPVFRRLQSADKLVDINVNGEVLALPEGEPLAAALLVEGRLATSHALNSGEPRGPFCLMGTCAQCSAEIDGVQHQRTCRTPVKEGMNVILETVKRPEKRR